MPVEAREAAGRVMQDPAVTLLKHSRSVFYSGRPTECEARLFAGLDVLAGGDEASAVGFAPPVAVAVVSVAAACVVLLLGDVVEH